MRPPGIRPAGIRHISLKQKSQRFMVACDHLATCLADGCRIAMAKWPNALARRTWPGSVLPKFLSGLGLAPFCPVMVYFPPHSWADIGPGHPHPPAHTHMQTAPGPGGGSLFLVCCQGFVGISVPMGCEACHSTQRLTLDPVSIGTFHFGWWVSNVSVSFHQHSCLWTFSGHIHV